MTRYRPDITPIFTLYADGTLLWWMNDDSVRTDLAEIQTALHHLPLS